MLYKKKCEECKIMKYKYLLLMMIIVMFTGCGEGNTETTIENDEKIVTQQSTSDEMKEKLDKYQSISKEYNEAVDKYNESVQSVEELIDDLSEYNVIVEYAVEKKQKLKTNITEEELKKIDFDGISEEIKKISADEVKLNKVFFTVCKRGYKDSIDKYNTLAEAYNGLIKEISVDYINDIPTNVLSLSYDSYVINEMYFRKEDYLRNVKTLYEKTNKLASDYMIVDQLNAPNAQWITTRLKNVSSIIDQSSVGINNDPNQLLGKENGGYKCCVYFTLKQVDASTVKGDTPIEKGTDGGGCIESYPTLEAARNRCDYLSQFDDTLLYSGSYAAVGTMVVRTSYKLDDQQQVAVTDEIVRAFTCLE